MADLEKLKNGRKAVKTCCGRIKTYVNSVKSTDVHTIANLKVRRNKLDQYWSRYDDIQTEIEGIDETSNDRESFERDFFELSAKIEQLLDNAILPRQPDIPNASTSNAAASVPAVDHGPRVHLPKLSLPSFSGNYQEWMSFSRMFETVIINNTTLANIEKLQYLKSSLSGTALDSIQSLELSHDNFQVAWDLLKKRYHKLRVTVQSHIQAIIDIPPLKKEKHHELRNLVHTASKHINSLKTLQRPTEQWDDILVHILANKLDSITFREWENSLTVDEMPEFDKLLEFLIHRCETLEALAKREQTPVILNTNNPNARKSTVNCVATIGFRCTFCNGDHPIYYCRQFIALPIDERFGEIRKRKLCTNCLKTKNHLSKQCKAGSCKNCSLKHNTLLHGANAEKSTNQNNQVHKTGAPNEVSVANSSNNAAILTHTVTAVDNKYVLLSTALVDVFDKYDNKKQARVLLDSGSQANLITSELVSRLQLNTKKRNISIIGINHMSTNSSDTVTIKLQSKYNRFYTTIECIVTDRITNSVPSMPLNKNRMTIPKNIRLADPNFHVPSTIDLLLGTEVFWQVMCIGQIKPSSHNPTIQKTHFGWILAGSIGDSLHRQNSLNSFLLVADNTELNQSLLKFWQFEDIPMRQNIFTPSELACEKHFLEHVRTNNEGRFIVSLPTRFNGLQGLGDSRHIALKRFLKLEKRLEHDEQLKKDYSKFINEYLQLGHMKLINEAGDNSLTAVYLPHHCVFKETSTTTRLRVVFDASCKTESGVSLNDILLTGPVVQQDLFSLILRFRTYKYVFTADIIKMYRQILIDPKQTSLQRILWRDSSQDTVQAYELQTVTYGTATASYLATRCLQYLSQMQQTALPVGSEAVSNDFYMDDLLTGANSLQEARIKRDEIISVLSKGKFVLSKWTANEPSLLKDIQSSHSENTLVSLDKDSDFRILGLQWDPHNDFFRFEVRLNSSDAIVTKRTMLSQISRLFDPLGLLGPIVIVAKLMIQSLWQLKTDWDESVPMDIHTRWFTLKEQFSNLQDLQIPRLVAHSANDSGVEIHGFADASQLAYGACCYIRAQDEHGNYSTVLLASKSRVAPMKAISLPRLELCAALLLAQLYHKITQFINVQVNKTYLWSDSTITLAWIKSESRKWTVFVSNRVGEIQRLTRTCDWRHVESKSNPADLISRGTTISTLINTPLWWHGPDWLSLDVSHWPISSPLAIAEDMPEQAKNIFVCQTSENTFLKELVSRFSNLGKLVRIVAYCLRYINNSKSNSIRRSGIFKPEETQQALRLLCKLVQGVHFVEDIARLKKGQTLSTSSKILCLSPFLDEDDIIRVGGRLKNSDLSYDSCHPILLPKNEALTTLIVRDQHVRNFHAGTQATIYATRSQFWPISARSVTRKIIRNCITCFKNKPLSSEAIMSNLPIARVVPSRPFSHCGIDFGGPFMIREAKRRNVKLIKVWIAVFVCFATRAVHIEVVGDLSAESFIGALRRFMARRGRIACIYTDNGTNFVGAARELKELHDYFIQEQVQRKLNDLFVECQIEWNFIPPHAPHFGGLWEAAIKSFKHHMKRVIGNANLNYDEFTTVLCEIESILNSRPLSALSNDPNDMQPLTPGHFLVGSALNSVNNPDITDIKLNRLSRWQLVERIRQDFWKRWSNEYLNQLQGRSKWKANKGVQLKTGQLVLIHQPGLAPLQWLLGRVETVNIGSDGNIRSADIKTKNGILARPLTKLSILPVDL